MATTKPLDYNTALRDVAKSLVRLKRPERLLKMITRFLYRELSLTHVAILVLDTEKSHYTVFDSQGIKKLPRSLIRFDPQHPLVRWFQPKNRSAKGLPSYLLKDKIQSLLRGGASAMTAETRKDLTQLDRVFKDLRIHIAIPGHFKDSLVGILLLGEKLSRGIFTEPEIEFFQILVHDVAIAVKTTDYHQRLIERNAELEAKKKEMEEKLREIEHLRKKEQDTYYQIVKSLAQEVHAKDPYTFGHIKQVEKMGVMTAQEMNLDLTGKKKAILSASLLLHDVGKIGIPDNILKKPGSLNTEEWKIMRSHVEKGAKILEPLTDFKEVAEIIRCHHENYDGSGYPRGLKADQIPVQSRIVSVVDAFHAIVSTRCYREGRPIEVAFQELQRCAGTQFDPNVVTAFIRAFKRTLNRT